MKEKGSVSVKRKRVASSPPKYDQNNIRYTMLNTQLQGKGLELCNSKEEREFIEHGPTGLGKIMAMIADMIKERVQNETASTS